MKISILRYNFIENRISTAFVKPLNREIRASVDDTNK